MADLPIDHLSTEPPFTYVGLDVFGPWTVVARRTRGGQAQKQKMDCSFHLYDHSCGNTSTD